MTKVITPFYMCIIRKFTLIIPYVPHNSIFW